jgi:hypothetical protein
MGLIMFWVYDRSPNQSCTKLLFDKTLKMMLLGFQLARLPFLRPLHRVAGELLEVIYGTPPVTRAAEEERGNLRRE